jgi:hypothetical protein
VLVDLPLVPWADLPMMHIMFSQRAPNIAPLDTPVYEVARLRHVCARNHETMLRAAWLDAMDRVDAELQRWIGY